MNIMSKRGVLVIVSGFSGTGKGTVVRKLVEKYDQYALSVSATTRNPRDGEEEGISYFFKTRDEFLKMIEQDAFLEYAEYVGNFYGTPSAYVDEMLSQGKNVILEIEVAGAKKVREKCPEALMVFMIPPSIKELVDRLKNRGSETEESIKSRLRQALKESEDIDKYDCILVNETVDDCVDLLHNIIVKAKNATKDDIELINEIKKDLNKFLEGEL